MAGTILVIFTMHSLHVGCELLLVDRTQSQVFCCHSTPENSYQHETNMGRPWNEVKVGTHHMVLQLGFTIIIIRLSLSR